MLVAKAVRKGRTQAEVDEIIGWLTGYSAPQIEAAVQNETLYGDFFRDAPQLNPDRVLIKGSICGGQLRHLTPGQAPKAVFELGGEKPVAIYAYCNLHGLWMTKL